MVQVNPEMAWNFSEREKISFAQEITVWIEKKSFLCEKTALYSFRQIFFIVVVS